MTASLVFPSFRYFSPSATVFCFLTSGLCEHPKPPRTASPTMSRTADRPDMPFAIGFTVAPRRGRTSHKSETGLTLEKIPSKGTLSQSVDYPTESTSANPACHQGAPGWGMLCGSASHPEAHLERAPG